MDLAQAYDALREVLDPETGVNLLDMGLIYAVAWDPPAARLAVTMTLTTAACPAGESMIQGVERRLRQLSGVADVSVEVTFDPKWTPEKITADGRAQLGWSESGD